MEKIVSFDKQGRIYLPEELRKYLQFKTFIAKSQGKGIYIEPVEENPIYALSRLGKKLTKSISQLKKGDKIKVNGKTLEIDTHYVFEDYKTTKEMIIEVFDPKTDKDYQIRYFNDQVEDTIKFFELENDFVYGEKETENIEW